LGCRDAAHTVDTFQQRLYDTPPTIPTLLVPCGRRVNKGGEQSLETELVKVRNCLEAGEADDPALKTALDLLLSGDSKWGLPDQLRTQVIEYSVALESLLLDQEAELAYRFALRLSVLRVPVGDRMQAFDQARTVYKVRSNAVHAGARSIRIGDAEVEATRRLLRLSVLRYLRLQHAGLKRRAILELLDRALLSASAAQELSDMLKEENLWPVEAVE
jgi:hypothetical protein